MVDVSVSLSEIFVSLLVFLVGIYYFGKRTNKKLPPGPTPIPLIGNILQIGRLPHVTFFNWGKVYGAIYKIKMATMNAIVVNDVKLIREVFNDVSSTGRSLNPVITEFTKGSYGVLNGEGEAWEVHRKFTLRKLREFGFSKNAMESKIMTEVEAMMEWLRERENRPMTGNRIFNAPVVNSLFHILTGERFEWEKGTQPEILILAEEFFELLLRLSSNGLFFLPFLRFVAPRLFGWTQFVAVIDKMIAILEKSIAQHKEALDPANPKDYIDHMLVEINGATDPKSCFYKETGHKHLVASVFDLFEAGSETSSHTLSWSLLYLSNFPKVQKRLQAEIDSEIGLSRLPCLADRASMPYAQAVIAETLRKSTVLGVGVPHRMIVDKEFQGFWFPKNTVVFGNIYAAHNDPLLWDSPEEFKPERFLNEDETKYCHKEGLISFSVGKRECLGAGMAKDTLFLFMTTIFQQFNVLPEHEGKVEPDFEPQDGLMLVPKQFKIKMVPRIPK